MEMINRETILEILVMRDDAFFCNDFLDGLKLIGSFVGAVRVVRDEDNYATVAVDTMLAYNFSEEACKELNDLGWYVDEEYLRIQL